MISLFEFLQRGVVVRFAASAAPGDAVPLMHHNGSGSRGSWPAPNYTEFAAPHQSPRVVAETAGSERSQISSKRWLMRSEERRVGKECRSRCDWSSDVCSSDLSAELYGIRCAASKSQGRRRNGRLGEVPDLVETLADEIGRASCRERV